MSKIEKGLLPGPECADVNCGLYRDAEKNAIQILDSNQTGTKFFPTPLNCNEIKPGFPLLGIPSKRQITCAFIPESALNTVLDGLNHRTGFTLKKRINCPRLED